MLLTEQFIDLRECANNGFVSELEKNIDELTGFMQGNFTASQLMDRWTNAQEGVKKIEQNMLKNSVVPCRVKYSKAHRSFALRLCSEGKGVRSVARELGIPHTTIQFWLTQQGI